MGPSSGSTPSCARVCDLAWEETLVRARASSTLSRPRPPGWVANRGATTEARRCAAGSVTSWWIRKVWSSKPRYTQRQGARPGRPEAPPAGVGEDRALAPEAPLARGRIGGKGQAVGREEDMGLSVEVVGKPPKPVPEEVAKIWAEE